MTTRMGIVLAALLVTGCGSDKPVVIALTEAPPECYVSHDANPETARQKKDPRWVPFPDDDVRRAKAARTISKNKSNYGELERLRAICDAGLRGA